MQVRNLAVIGSGFGGLAAALRAKAKGYNVTLYEKGNQLGGRARVFEYKGYRHDAGPTVITAPQLLEELFSLFGKSLSDYIELKELSLWYRFVYPDGSHFNYGKDLSQTLEQISHMEPTDVEGYKNLLKKSEDIFKVGFDLLATKPFDRFSFMAAQIPCMIKLKAYQTVWRLVSSHLKNNKLRQAFSIQPLLVGGNPFNTTSIYSLIHYLERKWGVHYPIGGTGAIVSALEKLMIEQGIIIKKNCEIKKIRVINGQVESVVTSSNTDAKYDIVISNMDPSVLYNRIDSNEKNLNWKVRLRRKHAKYSMALFVLFFGTRKKYEEVAHHTIWLGKRYKELLQEIFHGNLLPEDFSLYLHRPTATDPDFAPNGCDSFYVLAPVPNLKACIDWEAEGPRYSKKIIQALHSSILPGLNECIEADFYMTPNDFKNDYLSEYGAGFSIAPIFYQSAWFRYHNKGEGIRNLFLVGAGTHPGAGLPGVLCSAKVVDSLI